MTSHTHTRNPKRPSQTASTSSGPCRRPGAALGRTNGTEGCHEKSGAESRGWLFNRFCRLMVVENCLVVTGPCCFLLFLPFLFPTGRSALPTSSFILPFLLSVSFRPSLYFCLAGFLLTAISPHSYKDSRPVGFSIMFLSVCIVAVLKDVCVDPGYSLCIPCLFIFLGFPMLSYL